MNTLWTEAYRPVTLEQYVWRDPTMRATVEQWLKDGALPHVLFSGGPGTGKTSLCKLLLRCLEIPAADILYINASRERQIDAFQDRIINFVDAWALGPSGIKYILLDESDKMSPLAQGLLRNEIETYSDICRFLLTANEPRKILPAIHSRLQELRFPSLDRNDFSLRLADILVAENVEVEVEVLLAYVEAAYPDLRKCINLAQQNTRDGRLAPLRDDECGAKSYLPTLLDLFRKGRFQEARRLVIARIQPDEYDAFYQLLYQNLQLFGKTQVQQEDALLVIRKAVIHHAVVADAEINLAACMVELTRLTGEQG